MAIYEELTNCNLETKIIGGEAMFKQEFGIEFITGDKLLFHDIEMEKYRKKIKTYKHSNK